MNIMVNVGVLFVAFATIASAYPIKNKFKSFIMTKAMEIKGMAEQFMAENDIPYKPSPDYP